MKNKLQSKFPPMWDFFSNKHHITVIKSQQIRASTISIIISNVVLIIRRDIACNY